MSETGGALAGAPPDCAAPAVRPASHVYSTSIDETTILLDLRRDKYLAVNAALLALAVEGREDECAAQLRTRLLADGVLWAQPALRPRAAKNVHGAVSYLNAFVAATLWAEWSLRARRLDLAVLSLRRAQIRPERPVPPIASALTAFGIWRPWYPRRNVCLFDSLALARFLIFAGHRIELVFGVRLNSFAAHCWIEAGGVIVNDEPHYCSAFQEIARIG